MTTRKDQLIESVVEPVCRAHGLELVQVRRITAQGGVVLRVMIERPPVDGQKGSGITLGDCQAVSRDLGPALDVNEVMGGSYRLEVSSPGLDRPLVKLEDFERFSGRKVQVRTRAAQPDGQGGERRKFSGQLLGIKGEVVRLLIDGTEVPLPHATIERANVVHEH